MPAGPGDDISTDGFVNNTSDKKINMKADIDKELEKLLQSHRTVIKVFGAGGAGNNTISRLLEAGTENVETFALNTGGIYGIDSRRPIEL